MKLACSSTAFDELLRSGDLTQLEWLDLCAHDLAADGAVFDVRHFPRTDTDYLAQVKKMAADAGLTVAALRHDGFFSADRAHMEQTFEIALAIGAPLLGAPLPLQTQTGWDAVLETLGAACSLAKRHNVTLAVRNAPHTFAASMHDLKRVGKEADSAWLRYGPEPGAFEASDDPAAALGKAVLVWEPFAPVRLESTGLLAGFHGFVALDAAAGDVKPQEAKNALRAWRKAFLEADRT